MIREVVRQIVGKRLTSAVATFHAYEGHVSPTPTSVWLTFDGAPRYRFHGAPDGWHMVVDEESPKEVNMQESGALQLVDIGVQPPFSRVLKQYAREAWLISSPSLQDIVGVRFDFEAGTVRVFNWGDEIYVTENLPTESEAEGIIEWRAQ
jgi:hypothetical protein